MHIVIKDIKRLLIKLQRCSEKVCYCKRTQQEVNRNKFRSLQLSHHSDSALF